jgi:hypothetical protein
VKFQTSFRFILVGLINMIMVCRFGHQFFWTDIMQFLLVDTIVTTTFCHEFVRNISAKIIHHWLQSLLLLSNGPELALHRHDREFKKKNMHKFYTLQCKNNKLLLSNHHLLWRNIYTSSVCDSEHFVLKIHNFTSCCST